MNPLLKHQLVAIEVLHIKCMYLSTNLCRLTAQVIPSDFEQECKGASK